jgi:hypothetical protein
MRLAPHWHVRATVGAYPVKPPMTWGVHILDKLDDPGALGYHTDANRQPVAFVERTDDWPSVVCHEVLEMLADPWGNRMHGARLPAGLEDRFTDFGLAHRSTHVHYLLEVCDPCEATSYEVGGQLLSDFLLPAWYRTNPTPRPAYSHAGGCYQPRQVAPGGYVSFIANNEWFQVFNEGGKLEVQALGRVDADLHSLREFTDLAARDHRAR